jgi:transposase
MANQLKMADVQAILTLHGHGWSCRRIARELDVHRETVGNYLRRAAAAATVAPESKPASAPPGSGAAPLGVALWGVPGSDNGDDRPGNPNPASAPTGSGGDGVGIGISVEVEAVVAGAAKPSSAPSGSWAVQGNGNNGNPSAAWPWREVINRKLEQGLGAQRIYQDLTSADEGHGYTGSYYSVRRLIRKLCGGTPLPVRRMECDAGQEAQVDFGRGAPIRGADGKRRGSWVFRIVLSHSRKGYSEVVSRQTTDEFLRCLENAFAHFGGVPKTLVIDNLRAAVARADWYDPELCPKVRSFAEHYGMAILPTRPRTPRHKGKVEGGVKYVKANALAGRTFASLADQNRHLAQWESAVADTRIHGTTRKQVIKLFTEVERAALLPLPASRFELFHEALRTAHRDGHVMIKGAHYSVPPEYLGQQLWVRWDGRTVRLFDQKMRSVAVHAQKPPGAFSTIDAHLHPHKISGIERGTDWLLGQAQRIGPQARAWAEAMLASRGIEGVRVLLGLTSLPNRHPRPAIERACQIALSHGAYHLRTLRQLIQHHGHDDGSAAAAASAPIQQTFAFASEHPIIRPVADYGRWLRDVLAAQPPEQRQECIA